MRFSPEYKALQEKLHAAGDYGTSGHKHANYIIQLAKQLGSREVLDYGCGKCTLSHSLPFKITNYDPMQAEFHREPEPHDLVVCSDVLEHIEPDCLDDVVAHLRSLTKKLLFIDVACRPARKVLADGRNAHLIQWTPATWLRYLLSDNSGGLGGAYLPPFNPVFFQAYDGGFIAVLTK